MEAADFSGWATKANLRCSDGRTIMPEAFAHMDGKQVPLVWQHRHSDVENVLGHAILEAREEGVYAYCFLNDTAPALHAKKMIKHKDVNALSIFANGLVERSKSVFHGVIRELSLVLSGANPGALIDNIQIAHSEYDDPMILEDEAIIHSGLTGLEFGKSIVDAAVASEEAQEEAAAAANPEVSFTDEQKAVVHTMIAAAVAEAKGEEPPAEGEELVHAADNPTLKTVVESFSEEQLQAVYYMIGTAVQAATLEHSATGDAEGTTAATDIPVDSDNPEGDLVHQEGSDNMTTHNLFEGRRTADGDGPSLSHSDIETIQAAALKGGSYKEAFLAHAESLGYGIDDIEFLFPDARTLNNTPDVIARRTEWVAKVLDGAKHSPFSRVKSIHADLTAEQARAKGYVKGNLKKDEVIKLLKRVTTPTTVYKKQKLDRDDIVDITDLDVVAWLKWEMRFMLEEELARAILVGDGREPDDEDKIDEDRLRPIAWDHDMYSHSVNLPSNTEPEGIVEGVLRARKFYKGTGRPTFFTTDDILTDMLLIKDKLGRRIYMTEGELAAALRVSEIVVVEVMEDTPDLLGIMVNMTDYTIGADKGGQLAMFDDFDIDYNQQKYLIETRISGALTKAKSAVVVKRTSGTTVTPVAPAFDEGTNTLTVPTVAGVSYFNVTNPLAEVELVDGQDYVLTETTDVEARADAGYNFPHNFDADWTYAVV